MRNIQAIGGSIISFMEKERKYIILYHLENSDTKYLEKMINKCGFSCIKLVGRLGYDDFLRLPAIKSGIFLYEGYENISRFLDRNLPKT